MNNLFKLLCKYRKKEIFTFLRKDHQKVFTCFSIHGFWFFLPLWYFLQVLAIHFLVEQ